MSPVLSVVLFVGFVSAGLAALVRSLPWSDAQKRRKPLSCPVCMAGHAAWIVTGSGWLLHVLAIPTLREAAFLWLGATGVAAFLLTQMGLFHDGTDVLG